MSTMIRRTASVSDLVVVRAKDEEDESGEETLRFSGHAAVFNQPTLIGSRQWGFVEWLEPGAFKNVLKDDVRFLFNHDGMPLARTTNDTLKLSEDKVGLVSEAELAPVQLSRDIATLVASGDISQMSFAFYPGEERVGKIDLEKDGKNLPKGLEEFDGLPYRAVTSVRQLFDVSPVTYPAYEGTDASMVSKKIEAEVRSFMEQHQQELRFVTKYSSSEIAARLRDHRLADIKA